MGKSIKAFIYLFLFIAVFALAYFFRAEVFSFVLSRDFKMKVSLEQIDFSKNGVDVEKIRIENHKEFAHSPALFCKSLGIRTSLKKFFAKKLVIDEIALNNLELNIEFLDEKQEISNFTKLLNSNGHHSKKAKKGKGYLIKKLILKDITINLFFLKKSSKKVKIKEIEFENISNETGFPIDQIEKAILHEIMRSVFKKVGIKSLLKNVTPNYLAPKLIPFL